MKTCSICKSLKPLTAYCKHKYAPDGLSYTCRPCNLERSRTPESKERKRKYRQRKLDEHKKWDKERYERKRDYILKRQLDYYYKNRDEIREKRKTHSKKHKQKLNHKLGCVIRSRINKVIKKENRSFSAVETLACSLEEFISYLESKFQPGMTWENRGFRGWHIDHIKPLCSFDLLDPEQFKEATHYTNLQPLWAKDNYKKGRR